MLYVQCMLSVYCLLTMHIVRVYILTVSDIYIYMCVCMYIYIYYKHVYYYLFSFMY